MSGNGGDGRRGRLTVPVWERMPEAKAGPWTVAAVRGRLVEMVLVLELLSEAERARLAAGGGLRVGPKGFPVQWPLGAPVAGRWDYPGEAAVRAIQVGDQALDRALEANGWLRPVAATSVGEVLWLRSRGETLRQVGDALGLSAPFVRRMAALGWVLVTDEANRLARQRRGRREFVVYKQGGLGVEAR